MLAGRNWAAEAQSACEGKGEAVGEAKRLDQLPLQDVLEKADHVIDVRLHVLTCALGNRLHAGASCRRLPMPLSACARRTRVWAKDWYVWVDATGAEQCVPEASISQVL